MSDIFDLISVPAPEFRTGPMARHKVSRAEWQLAIDELARGGLSLLSLWASRGAVHMALRRGETGEIGVISVDSRRKTFPSVGVQHPAAQRLERAMVDLFGLSASGAIDARPWLDHGVWGLRHPMGKTSEQAIEAMDYQFLPSEGESLHQAAVGPVHAGIIEPGHFRFTTQGEIVVRLEARLGYAHKGVDALMSGVDARASAHLAARVCGDSSVAYGWAYAQAVEAALGVEVPARAIWLRALMAELERLANHLGDIGAICNDAAFGMMLARTSLLRERVLRECDTCFGHRFMKDVIVPGGITRDLDGEALRRLRVLTGEIGEAFAPLVALYDATASLLDRTVGAGVLSPELAQNFAAGGFVGRASGRDFDARRDLAYAPYDQLEFSVPTRRDGDVNARIWIRIDEVAQSLSLIGQILDGLPQGAIAAELPSRGAAREGLGLIEGFRGDILVWVKFDGRGRIARCHLRDPSWFQWPLLEAVIKDNILADFPLCNKSFNCAYSGVDL
ncbi:MAG: hydrogenase expression protein HypE [Alphaproteobacteria bacterium]|nr:hydrogenase expression protein HypE [Alphaproteobacteria bacterium]